jgi:hypothetical protein
MLTVRDEDKGNFKGRIRIDIVETVISHILSSAWQELENRINARKAMKGPRIALH